MQSDHTKEGTATAKDRLWVVTELYYPEVTSTGYYLTHIAEGLADQFDVKALCGQPTYAARGTIAPKREFHKGVEIFRASGTTLDKNVIPFRVLNMITLGLSIFVTALYRFKRGDRVLVVTTPPSLPFVAAISSLVKGASYTLLIHDNYPEILVATKKAKPHSFIVKTLSFLNRWLYKYAAKIIVVGSDMKQLLEKKTEGLDIPIVNIPNWAELESVEPRPRADNQLLRQLRLQDKLVFLYAGNMGHPNDLESIISAAERLKGKEEIHFIFLGAGVKRKWLEESVADLSLNNVTVLDPRPRSEQNDFLNACDVGIVSLVEHMVGVSMPSRTYNILAAGKPVLAMTEEGSELARIVAEERVGWTVPPGLPNRLAETILMILRERKNLPSLNAAARDAAVRSCSLEVALEKYRRTL